jgi:4'-phosphopantetheinyl transferase
VSVDTARVWLVDARVPEATLAGLSAVLDDDELARARAYRHDDDRRRFVVAHGAVRHVLGDLLGIPPAEIGWRRGPHGKPELTGPPAGLPVNLSHSGDLTLVCVGTGRAVGVDVQRVEPDRDVTALATRFFPPDEAEHVLTSRTAGTRAHRFATLWTRKEAVVKAGGGRLAQGLRTGVREPVVLVADQPGGIPPGPYRLTGVPVPHGYRAAVALYGADAYEVAVRSWTWTAAVHR